MPCNGLRATNLIVLRITKKSSYSRQQMSSFHQQIAHLLFEIVELHEISICFHFSDEGGDTDLGKPFLSS